MKLARIRGSTLCKAVGVAHGEQGNYDQDIERHSQQCKKLTGGLGNGTPHLGLDYRWVGCCDRPDVFGYELSTQVSWACWSENLP
jgi:hypothetical protein